MIRLYFHIRQGDRLSKDPEGAEFNDLETARAEAVRSARELLSQRVLNGEEIDGQAFELTSEDGAVVDTVRFRDVLRLHEE
ncbi:hypothetical protein GCM10010924_59730 [Rhizobium wenxiniae]|jgi:hypothetical protein|uniref:DUF6894 domain-containing protein n=1 Tax=Rhizobium wenxiniae TaxID=1737357 RepID=A0A7W9YCY2_9HYPH|nr:hypothetical protein [Rhizobium wenxiniae]MBB6166236.1 hypothetical protein [Rhizobium wenxiniae]GGG22243.1 hypothetical protein GCM10010924_59730 [Rhizobium wenxiniae]